MDPDPYISGPPGSGSAIICTDPDPGPLQHQTKIVRKTFLSLKNDENVSSKST